MPGVEYVGGCVSGMLIPSNREASFYKEFDKISVEQNAEFVANIPMDDYIKYELYNYECIFTGDYMVAFEHISPVYPDATIEDVKRVYLAEVESQEAIQNPMTFILNH